MSYSRKRFRKGVAIINTIATVVWSMGGAFLGPIAANAVVSEPAGSLQDFSQVTGQPNKVKAGATIITTFFAPIATDNETLTSVKFQIDDVSSSGLAATDFGLTLPVIGLNKVVILQDTDSPSLDIFNGSLDPVVGKTNTINIGSPTTVTLTAPVPLPSSMAGRGVREFAIVLAVSVGAVEGHKFKITVPADNTAFALSAGTVTSGGILSGGAGTITIDNTAPLANGAGGPPDDQKFSPPDALIDRTFSEALLATNISTADSSVTLRKCNGSTAGGDTANNACGASGTSTTGANLCTSVALSDSDTRVTCSHSVLESSTWYDFKLGVGITDVASNALAASADFRFKTGDAGGSGSTNNTPPRVLSVTPEGFDVARNTKFFVEFSTTKEGDMLADGTANAINNVANVSIKKFVSNAPSTEVCTSGSACVLTWDSTNRRLKIAPASSLEATSEFDLCIRGNTRNSSTQSLGGDFCRHFKTSAVNDTTAPALRTTGPTFPANAATNVSRFTADYSVAFSEAMDPSTLTSDTVRLCVDGNSNGCDGVETRLGTADLSFRYDPFEKALHMGPKRLNNIQPGNRMCFEVVGTTTKDIAGVGVAATVGTNCFTINASEPDPAGPKLLFADADAFKVVAHFDKPALDADATNLANYALQCPVGVTANLTNKPISYKVDRKEVEISDLGLQQGQNCRLTISNIKALTGTNVASGDEKIANFNVQDPNTTGGNLGTGATTDFKSGTNFATFWASPQRCQPRSQLAGATTSLECEFPTPQALTTGATITLSLPTGFTATNLATRDNSFFNSDLNGPGPGITTMSSIVNTADTSVITLAHSGTAMGASDRLHFELNGLVNPATPGTDLRVSVIVKDSTGIKVGQTIQAQPFNIQQFSGSALSISGTVFKDTNSNGTRDAGEGINGMSVFCDSMGGFGATGINVGHLDATTNASGDYTMTGLSDGQYGCGIPADPTKLSDLAGADLFRNIQLGGASKTGVNFKFSDLSVTGKTLRVNITGGPLSKALDVFCHAGASDFQFSAPVVKNLTTNGSGVASADMKLQPGKSYECGVGPHIDSSQFATGGPPPVPTFEFMPPRMTSVTVPTSSDPAAVTFALVSATNTITGTVQDGSVAGIPNAFVNAEPVGCFDATTGAFKDCHGSFTQSKSDGTFTLNVGPGTYRVSAGGPGLPQSTQAEVTVKSDNTKTSNGVAVVGGITLKILKSSTTISGSIKDESGNGIKYAHVSAEKITAGETCASITPTGGRADSPTDSNGAYTLYVGAGTWCVRSFAPSYGEVGTKTVVITGSTSQTSQDIQATAAEFGTISGTATKGGTATGGAFVNCFGSAGGNNAKTSTDGSFSMKVKAGANYNCDGFLEGVGPLAGSQSNFTVTAGGTETVTMSVGNPGTIQVTVTGITDAFCDARSTSGRGNGTGRNDNGVYSIFVPAGTYNVRCGGPKYGSLVDQSAVVVTAGATVTVSGTAPTTRTVAGSITDGSANLEGVTLKFTESSSGKSFNVKTGAQPTGNNLSATGIAEGTYTVIASKSGYEPEATTATVSGGNLTIADPIALTKASGANGTNATVTVQQSGVNYTGDANVIATKDGNSVVAEIDENTGQASLPLTNGTWSVTAIGDNGKSSTATTITVAGGAVSGSAPTVSLANSVTGFTPGNETETIALNTGGLIKFEEVAPGSTPIEVNVPASTLSATDSSTGKIEIQKDPTIKIDPGADQNFVGSSGYELTPTASDGSEIHDINGTVKVTIPYLAADVTAAGVSEEKLTLAAFDTASQTWEVFPTTVDASNDIIFAEVDHFSSFGIIGTVSTSSSTRSSRDVTAPSVPTGVSIATDGSAITVSWTDPTDTDLDMVRVYRDHKPTAGTVNMNELHGSVGVGVKKFIDNGPFLAGQEQDTYKYQLVAVDANGNVSLATDPVSIKRVAPTPAVSSGSTGGGGGSTGGSTGAALGASVGSSTQTTTATQQTPAVAAGTTTTTVAPSIPVDARAEEINKITAEAAVIFNADAQATAALTLTNVSVETERAAMTKYVDKITAKVADLSTEQKDAMAYFVAYGTPTTVKLGAGERAGVISSFYTAFGKMPENAQDWEDVMKIGNGRFPTQESETAVAKAKAQFKKVYKRDANLSQANDSAAVTIMAYGLRSKTRVTASEKSAITSFKAIYKHTPQTTAEWDVMRAIAYSGAKR